jgi:hypothetical protein
MENVEAVSSFVSNAGTSGSNGMRQVLHQVRDELRLLLQQRAEVTQRICTAKRTIFGLATMLGDADLSKELTDLIDGGGGERKPGFTRACRRILMEAGHPLSAREVHDQLNAQAPMLLARHADPIASVTTVLNRLAEYGEAQRVLLKNGKRAWQWAAESRDSSPTGPVFVEGSQHSRSDS